MEKKTKIAALTSIIFIAVAASLYLSFPVAYAEIIPRGNGHYTISLQYRRTLGLGLNFLKNGVPETLTGDAVAICRSIVALNIEGTQFNVILPNKWIVDGEIVNTSELFDGEPLSVGQAQIISLKTLKLELAKDTHIVKAYVAYEIYTAGETIKALLPVNIQTD